MPINRDRKQINRARHLRRTMTDGEKRLWRELQALKAHGFHARKQVPLGPYVVDFAIVRERLVIEVDGEFHYTAQGVARDRVRDQFLSSQGYRILRINTGELDENVDGCIETILRELALT